jgi:hypothetical protein
MMLSVLQALLAGGTYNGELVIWDLNKDDADAQVGTVPQDAHKFGCGSETQNIGSRNMLMFGTRHLAQVFGHHKTQRSAASCVACVNFTSNRRWRIHLGR